jgi:uracil-DNA glycosylase
MNRNACKCGKLLIPPVGLSTSKVMLVGEFPGTAEIIKGIPFIGPTGDILKAEMARAGLTFISTWLTNLWRHAKDEKGCDVTLHMNALAQEMKGREFVLLMGSDLTKILWNTGVMELSGLEMKHDLFPGTRLFVSPNPAIVMHGPVGEFRLAVERFAHAVNGASK